MMLILCLTGKIQSAEKIEIKGDTITSQTIESKTILLNGGTVNSNLSADALIEINDGVLIQRTCM